MFSGPTTSPSLFPCSSRQPFLSCREEKCFFTCHYNFSIFEICHYDSTILKLIITILHFFELCHFLRLRCSWSHSQTHIFSYNSKYTFCFSPFDPLTCEVHTSASSSTSGLLQPSLDHALHTSDPTPGGLLPAAGPVSPSKPRLASRGQATAAPSGGHANAAAVAPSCGQSLI